LFPFKSLSNRLLHHDTQITDLFLCFKGSQMDLLWFTVAVSLKSPPSWLHSDFKSELKYTGLSWSGVCRGLGRSLAVCKATEKKRRRQNTADLHHNILFVNLQTAWYDRKNYRDYSEWDELNFIPLLCLTVRRCCGEDNLSSRVVLSELTRRHREVTAGGTNQIVPCERTRREQSRNISSFNRPRNRSKTCQS